MRFTAFARAHVLAAILTIGTLPAATTALAEPQVLDKSHTTVRFEVSHLGYSTTHGVFREVDAEISFDPEAVEETQVSFTIQTASVDTFWAARDDHLRKADFFNVAEFPTITFTSTAVTPTGSDTATVEGDLTMLGITKPVTFEAKLNKIAPSPFNPNKVVAGFTVTGEIDRTEFGMGYGAPAISAVIPFQVDLEMSPAQGS
ncbi:MAG: YceI family protein [Pseudomonadota bacterium]